MSDLVERLDDAHANSVQRALGGDIFAEAAARIRELEAELAALNGAAERAIADAVADDQDEWFAGLKAALSAHKGAGK